MTLPNEITINGVAYRRVELVPDAVETWVMFDNHTFHELTGNTVDALIAEWRAMGHGVHLHLCSVAVRGVGQVLRRVGPMVHAAMTGFPATIERQAADLAAWRAAVEADADIARLLKARGEEQP
jgi:hypothetical protein